MQMNGKTILMTVVGSVHVAKHCMRIASSFAARRRRQSLRRGLHRFPERPI